MSTIAERNPSATGAARKRAFLAGGTATTALVAAAALVFVSLAAYVAFNGIPVGGGEDGIGSVAIGSSGGLSGAPEAAAGVLAAAPAAVAATPAAPLPIAARPGGAEGGGAPATQPVSQGSAAVGGIGVEPGTGGQTPASAPGSRPGPFGGTVDGIEDGSGPTIEAPLGEATEGVTGPLDGAVEQIIIGIGDALGGPEPGKG